MTTPSQPTADRLIQVSVPPGAYCRNCKYWHQHCWQIVRDVGDCTLRIPPHHQTTGDFVCNEYEDGAV